MSDASSGDPLPTAEEVLAGLDVETNEDISVPTKYEQVFTENFGAASIRLEIEYAHLQGIIDHYRHKGKWSFFLIGLLGSMIGFQWALLWCVGAGVWDFTQYEWLLPILLVQNLGQIIGLAFIVVKSLFREIK
ncbi:MAG: hypothetical protein IOD01_16375 [Rhodobacter sp.]|jgi:hypothetical protein|nr:hypothetical protein [Rhodobacter sp.]